MYELTKSILIIVVVAALAGTANAAVWTCGAGDGNAWDPCNWRADPLVEPNYPLEAMWEFNEPNLCDANVTRDMTITNLIVGAPDANLGTFDLNVLCGAVIRIENTTGHFNIGSGGDNATGARVNVSCDGMLLGDGEDTFVSAGHQGNGSTGFLTVADDASVYVPTGVVTAGFLDGSYGEIHISGNAYVESGKWCGIGTYGEGKLIMTGGTLYVGTETSQDWRLIIACAWCDSGGGHIQLDGGLITTPAMDMGDDDYIGTMDITGGKLIVRNGQGSVAPGGLMGVIGDGRLSAYGGRGEFVITEPGDGSVEVTAVQVPPCAAWNPSPRNNQTVSGDLRDSLILRWTRGDYAAKHDVYFGTDFNDVNNADINDVSGIYRGRQDNLDDPEPNDFYPISEVLDLDTTCYWRIDEVNSAGTIDCRGSVWTFNISNYITMEGFENYADDTALRTVWDGYPADLHTLVTDNGHGGSSKSMKTTFNEKIPFWYSRSFSGGDRDWTQAGVEALELYFQGQASNPPIPMYIELSDGITTTRVDYDGDANDVIQPDWITGWVTWNVDLDDFTGVDLNDVNSIKIGFDATNPGGPSNPGSINIDNLRLYQTRCISSKIPGDIVGDDCLADLFDYTEFADVYLLEDQMVTPVAPVTGPVLLYHFEESYPSLTAHDSSGNGYDGEVIGSPEPWYDVGYIGKCIWFDGYMTVAVDVNSLNTVNNAVSVSFWINGDVDYQPQNNDYVFYAVDANELPVKQIMLASVPWGNGDIIWGTTTKSSDWLRWKAQAASDFEGTWTHYALVKDAVIGHMRIYRNGELVAAVDGTTEPLNGSNATHFAIGSEWDGEGSAYYGKLDEFQVFDYALTHAEVLHLAGFTTPQLVPINLAADTDDDGDVDLTDLGNIVEIWLTQVLWP